MAAATRTEQAYFLTVDWCGRNERGIFCDAKGKCFRKDDEPHTALETQEILGPFWVILNAKSELLNEGQVAEFTFWRPLEEYSNQYGIALKQHDVPMIQQMDKEANDGSSDEN